MLGLASVLQTQGHQVTFVTNAYFRPRVEALGLKYVELGTEQEYRALANDPRLWHPYRALPYILRSLVAEGMRPQYQIFCDHFEPERTIGIASCLGIGARIARDKLSMPLVTINLQPSVMWSFQEPPRIPGWQMPRWLANFAYRVGERFLVDPIACREINRFRAQLDLPPIRQLLRWWHSPDLVGCLFPDWFAEVQSDWPRPLVQTSFPLWDFGEQQPLSSEVRSFLDGGSPPIAFTPGSANVFGTSFFREAVKACQLLGRRGILLSEYSEHIPEDLPPECAYFPYVPFAQLLPHCAALVHHGGVGSTAQALQAGIPQLIAALAHDQFDNGDRIRRARLGDWMPSKQFTAGRAARILGRLLASEETHSACAKAVQRIKQHRGLEEMATAIVRHFADVS